MLDSILDPRQAITNLLGTWAIQSGLYGGGIFMNVLKEKEGGG